jgi:Bacterial regulatory helix-turn-helix protein, lysR family
MRDLNDLEFFAAVVGHRSFSAAARVLGVPKSRVSRRVALRLQNRLPRIRSIGWDHSGLASTAGSGET